MGGAYLSRAGLVTHLVCLSECLSHFVYCLEIVGHIGWCLKQNDWTGVSTHCFEIFDELVNSGIMLSQRSFYSVRVVSILLLFQ